jgi:hypothetical protein
MENIIHDESPLAEYLEGHPLLSPTPKPACTDSQTRSRPIPFT